MTKCPECNNDVSSFAKACPHCGYPLKEEGEEYYIEKGKPSKYWFAIVLKVLAVITWIGGLIISISGAYVTNILYSGRSTTVFSFATFLTLYLTYIINGVILMGLGTVAEQVGFTFDMIKGFNLKKRSIKSGTANSGGYSNMSFVKYSGWTCPTCMCQNKDSDSFLYKLW